LLGYNLETPNKNTFNTTKDRKLSRHRFRLCWKSTCSENNRWCKRRS